MLFLNLIGCPHNICNQKTTSASSHRRSKTTRSQSLIGAIIIELVWIWMLLYVEPVQNVFNTAMVPLLKLWILLPFPILLFVSHELYK
ncbi:MAG: cation transporting ATPase C-terminal domain-containing protein [Thermodesulfobacteriota bacterium]|nr:cation transporting ATPase C-terminal domain-containing protein [Thermodesulfobacteriota bacterium]